MPSSVTSSSIFSSNASIANSISRCLYLSTRLNLLTMYSFTVRLCKIAIKLFISSLIVDKPKSATGIGEIEERKLNCPAPDDRTTALEAYHLGSKRDIINAMPVTMIVFLNINLLLFQNNSTLPCKTSVSGKVTFFLLFLLSPITPYLFKSANRFRSVFSDIPFNSAIRFLSTGSETIVGCFSTREKIFFSCGDKFILIAGLLDRPEITWLLMLRLE